MTMKRDKEEVKWLTILLIGLILWCSFILCLLMTYGLDWSKKCVLVTVLVNIPTAIFIALLNVFLKSEVYIRTIEFYIHKYDRWNYEKSEYHTLYIIEQVALYQNFIYYKKSGTSTNKWSQLELENYCNNLPRGCDTFIGYNTQEEAMGKILEIVKDIIKEENSDVNVKVKNVGTVEVFTLDEIKVMIENM